MRILLAIAIFSFSFFAAKKISSKDLQPIIGNWSGNLIYTDYSSGKSVKILSDLTVTQQSDNEKAFILYYQYPKEPHANSYDTITISTNGKMLNDKKLISKEQIQDTLRLVCMKDGMDNSLPAELKYTYSISSSNFNIKKEIRKKGDANFMLRNQYSWRKQ